MIPVNFICFIFCLSSLAVHLLQVIALVPMLTTTIWTPLRPETQQAAGEVDLLQALIELLTEGETWDTSGVNNAYLMITAPI